MLVLHFFIALHADFSVVFCFALFGDKLVPLNASVALIEHFEKISNAISLRNATRCIRACSIDHYWKEKVISIGAFGLRDPCDADGDTGGSYK